MAKFYVQCASVRKIIDTQSADQAALAFVDVTLQSHLWIYDETALSNQDRRDHLMIEALLHLDPTIKISERGYDREDAQHVGTPETILQWHMLILAVTEMFVTAGLTSRTTSSIASIDGPAFVSPCLPR